VSIATIAGATQGSTPGISTAGDGAGFSAHLDRAAASASPNPPETLQDAVAPLVHALESVNSEATRLAAAAQATQAAGASVSPGDLIMLSMRCNEFLFHCELTANIADRGSDGVQQLFREEG